MPQRSDDVGGDGDWDRWAQDANTEGAKLEAAAPCSADGMEQGTQWTEEQEERMMRGNRVAWKGLAEELLDYSQGKRWFAEEEDILGKHQEFYKGWADGVFYSCDYAGQSATYNTYTIREFLVNKEFELVNQEKAFSKVFEENGLMNGNTKVFVHRITCNGSKVADRKVLYPFITVDGANKAFYVYEGAIITFTFEK